MDYENKNNPLLPECSYKENGKKLLEGKINLKESSKNYPRHAELVSISPYFQLVAGQARNEESAKKEVFRSLLSFAH